VRVGRWTWRIHPRVPKLTQLRLLGWVQIGSAHQVTNRRRGVYGGLGRRMSHLSDPIIGQASGRSRLLSTGLLLHETILMFPLSLLLRELLTPGFYALRLLSLLSCDLLLIPSTVLELSVVL
jgi:hypothetical protein